MGLLQANPELDLGLLEDEGEMPSPLLNLAAENGYCEFVEVLIDDGEVKRARAHQMAFPNSLRSSPCKGVARRDKCREWDVTEPKWNFC